MGKTSPSAIYPVSQQSKILLNLDKVKFNLAHFRSICKIMFTDRLQAFTFGGLLEIEKFCISFLAINNHLFPAVFLTGSIWPSLSNPSTQSQGHKISLVL